MKIIRNEEVKKEPRDLGRVVQKMLNHKFSSPKDSLVIFYSHVPKGKVDFHYHNNSEEIIIFPQGGKMEINKVVYSFEPWDILLIEPRDIHGFDGEDKDVLHIALRLPDNSDKISIKKEK